MPAYSTRLVVSFHGGLLLALLLALLMPLLGWGQVTMVNYDFNSLAVTGTFAPSSVFPTSTATNVGVTLTSSESTLGASSGITTGTSAFTTNAAGPSLSLNNSSGANTRYVQFNLNGTALNTYASYKLYFQSLRSPTGAQTITVAYSTNGTSFTDFGTTVTVPSTAFSESIIDLSAITALNNQNNVYFRLSASNASATGSLRIDNFEVQGTATPSPFIAVTPTPNPFAGFTTTQGAPSVTQSYALTGSNLTAGVAVAVASGYEVSQTSATAGFASSLVVTPTSGSVSTTVYVRLTGNAAGIYGTSGSPLQVANASTNATTRNVAVYGTVLAPEPTAQPGVSVANAAVAQADVTVSGGNGAYQLVVIRPTSATAIDPVDGASYTANTAFGSGTALGSNNFVVFTSTTGTNTFTVTGLIGNTSYTLTTYAFNGTGGTENYFVTAPGTAAFTTLPAPSTSYTWSGLGLDSNWTTALNWSPPRAVAAPTDVLVFNGSTVASPTVNVNFAAAGETVSQLLFRNNVTATLLVPAARTLTVDGNVAGDDFVVEAGSRAAFGTSLASAGLTVSLTASTTANIAGTLVFDGNSSFVGQHSLQGAATNAVQFVSGSTFRATAFYSQSGTVKPFGTTTANSVIFRTGSRFEQFAGSQPFGGATTVLTFEAGGRFVYAQSAVGSTPPSVSARTYGTLEFDTPDQTLVGNLTGASPLTMLGDLIITQSAGLNIDGGVRVGGSLQVNGSSVLTIAPPNPASGNAYTIKGDLLVNNLASFLFNPTTAAPLQFNGTTAQVIGGSAPATAVALGANASLTINNAAGVTLQRPLTLQKVLTLTSGKLTTTAANLLTLSVTSSTSLGSSSSFVNGPLARDTGTGAATVYFPVGKNTAFRPLTLNIASQGSAATYTAEQVEGNAGQNLAPGNGLGTKPLKRVSFIRSFTLASSNAASNTFGTVTLSFGTDDGVNDPASSELVGAVSAVSQPWQNLSRSASTGTGTGAGGAFGAGTLTSATFQAGLTAVAFALGATNDNPTLGQALNPLPVELTTFTAQRQADNVVTVQWATASEKNSAYFEVQRSLDGVEFTTVATITGQATSTKRMAYTSLDKMAPATALYYRLRQFDLDGAMAYSPVASVGSSSLRTRVLLYPNPAHNNLTVIAESATAYRVINQLGQALLTGPAAADAVTVPIETLPAGLYFLELQTATGLTVQKFEKE